MPNHFPQPTPIYWEVAKYYSLETNIELLYDFIDASAGILGQFKDSAKAFVKKRTTLLWEEKGYPLPRPEIQPLPDNWAPNPSTPYAAVYMPIAAIEHINAMREHKFPPVAPLTDEEKETFRGDS